MSGLTFPVRRPWRSVVFACLAVLLIAAAALLTGCSVGGGRTTSTLIGPATSMVLATTTTTEAPTTTVSTEPAFVQKEGEIYLDAAGSAGPEAFAGEVFVPQGPPSTLNIPTTTIPTELTTTTAGTGETTTTAEGTVQLVSYKGDTPALYGGSKSKKLADREGQLDFFDQNPKKAAAFCAALNSDPTFKWSGGTSIEPSQLGDYFKELTAVMLIKDTRVTNHGYRNGKPTPHQSVLQKGQLVLIDSYGVPRVRCECGNPLTPPKAVTKKPKYTGPRWKDFNPATIVVVEPTVVVIVDITLIDIDTGKPFVRHPGTEGENDTEAQATAWSLKVDMELYKNPITWTVNLVAKPDGTVSGSGKGTYRLPNGTTTKGSGSSKVNTGTFSVDAAFTLTVSGTIERTDEGQVLHVTPKFGKITLSNVKYDTTSDEKELRAELPGDMTAWISGTFATFDLAAVDFGSSNTAVTGADGSKGGATLTATQ